MTHRPDISISDAQESDFADIQRIYAPYVLHTTVSLEETPPDVNELKTRWKKSQEKDLPYLVARIDGKIAGYAYAMPYRPRTAYRFTVEESVYTAQEFRGMGVGKALLAAVIQNCTAKGYKQLVAVIAGTDNIASIKFHEALGFKEAGILRRVGFKFDQWVDTILMQRELS